MNTRFRKSKRSVSIISILFFTLFLFFLIAFNAIAGEFKFVVWGDSQFHNPQTFERIVQETELLKPLFVLHVGDMIHGYTYDPDNARRQWNRFKKQIAPLSVPFYPTPGNHDVTTAEIEPVYGEVWGKERYYYSFDYRDSHFIVLDTFLHQQYETIPEEEMQWLKADLEKNKDAENIFISLHPPLYLSNKYDWQSVHNLLKQYPVRAIFTGHSHIFDYRVRDGISYFCINSSGDMLYYNHLLGHSHHFVVVSVKGKDVDYAVVTADGGIYPPDAVPPDAYKEASKYLKEEQTIIIPNPEKGSILTEVTIPLENKTKNERIFVLTWETDDFRWDFEPSGVKTTLKPGESKVVEFLVSGPKGKFTRESLPRLKVSSPYKNERGWSTTLVYYYRLFYPPETTAKRLKIPLTIDGKMDDHAWQKVPAISQLFLDTKGTPAPEKTVVKVLYDDENLYVGIKGDEPNPKGLLAKAYGDLPLVFGDDDFELFFDTNRDLKTFYRLMVNPKGTVLCSGPDGLFSFKFEVKTYIGDKYWSAEFKIPYKEIKATPPKPGDVWGFNVRRHRQQAEPAQRDWSKMRNYPYQPQYFGLLKFD